MSQGKNIMEIMESKIQEEVEKLQTATKQAQKTIVHRQKLDSQLNENQLVQEEMDALEDGAVVYKLVGPALIKQDTDEAKQNVKKRIDYIGGELKRYDDMLKDIEKRQDEARENVANMQLQMQKLAKA